MRRIILSLLVVLSCYTTKAADGKSLFVTFKDGQKIEFALTTMPDISFAKDLMTIQSTETTATYELWKVNTFTYGTTTGISQLKTTHKFALEGNRIIVDGSNNKISAYTQDGKAVKLTTIICNNKTLISLDKLSHGMYIITINNKSLKIARQ